MSDHPYPDHAYLERDPETNEKRWYSSRGMGVCYVHEDRVQEEIDKAVAAERDACARIADASEAIGEGIEVRHARREIGDAIRARSTATSEN